MRSVASEPTANGRTEASSLDASSLDASSLDASSPAAPDAASPIAAGSVIEHYEIIRPLGRGGMGQVLLARDTRLGRLVALKLLMRQGHERTQRLLVEARATAQVRHDNIVVIYELGEHDGAPFMVLEYLRGKTLREWLDERSAPLTPARAVEIMIPVVRALVCAHEQGIVHRDLKPSNILLTDAGSVKVLDFGLAKLQAGPAIPRSVDAAAASGEPAEGMVHTAQGALLGTLPYMSPEQWLAQPVDHRADIWAVGLILAELVLGRHPLAPLSMLAMTSVGLLDIAMPRLDELCPDLGKLGNTIDRCLIKRADDRLGSARELLAELSAAAPSPHSMSADEDDNPYTGLSAFQESDAERFFGRGRAIMELVTRLADQPLIAVVGPSGAGKSSFVRAGVIPALRRSGDAWECFLVRPGPHPLSALAELLLRSGLSSTGDDVTQREGGIVPGRDEILRRLRAEPGLLGAELRARARRRLERVLVFVDQFEEVYTLASAEDREAFFACLSGLADDAGSPLRAIISLRSDFLDRVTEAHATRSGIGRGLMLLSPLDREGLREALIRPLARLDYRFEPASLVEEMLDTLEHAAGALPLLQFTAEKLWGQRDRARRSLTEESYRHVGGVEGTLARHADAVLGVMSTEEQRLARAALLRLVTPERTRAMVTRRELGELCAAPEQMESVLGKLTDARLLSVESGGGSGVTVELVHESLITRWPMLSRWVADNQEDAAFLARLKHAAQEWEVSAEAEDLLFRGRVADEARRWRAQYHGELARVEQRFLEASLALADRSQRRRRRIVAGVVALSALVATCMSYLAWQERAANHIAEQEATRAQAEAREARNATRMATARELQSDPTTQLALLREVEPPSVPRGWSALTLEALDSQIAVVVLTHRDSVSFAAFSPDGQRIVTASVDKTAQVWKADGTGEPLVLRGHEDKVSSAAWSPDGQRIVTASEDKTARVWKANGTGEPLVLRGHKDWIYSAAWSPDGQRIVTASYDKTVRVWRADGTGEPLVLRGHEAGVNWAAWSPDGQRIVTASYDKTVRVWRADGTGEPLVLRGHEAGVNWAAWSPDGQRIVTASVDKTARVWRADGTGEPLVLRGHEGRVYSATWSPDGQRIVTASVDKMARVWRADGTAEPLVLRGHEGRVYSATWSPDGKRIVTASTDRTARVWKVDGTSDPLVLHGHEGSIYSATWSPDGQRIVTGLEDKTARVWKADGAGELLVLRGHEDRVMSAMWSPDGQRIVTASKDRTARVWKADGTGEPLVLRGHEDRLWSAAFSPDGQRIVTASDDRTARVWKADGTGEPLILRGHEGIVYSAAWSPDGQHIVTASEDKTARVWKADGTGEPLVLRGHEAGVNSAAWSPDGQRIVTASEDKTARVWKADGTGEPLVLRGHEDRVSSAAWSPDGQRIVTASYDKTARVWKADGTGEPLLLRGHEDTVFSVAWSPDGKRVATASWDKTARVWANLAELHGPEEQRLWAATTYCLSVERRVKLLNISEAAAQADQRACERRVRALRE